jgi:3-oxoacyl-[acyl-carrier-protein] synthase III
MVLAPTEDEGRGIVSTRLYTDGRTAGLLCIEGGGTLEPLSEEMLKTKSNKLTMNGREVFKFAVRSLVEATSELLAAQNIRPEQVDHVIAHQANSRILEAVLHRLAIPVEKCWFNLSRYGNTSSASVPMTLDEVNRAGKLKEGDLIAVMAIGAGMTWGSSVVRW